MTAYGSTLDLLYVRGAFWSDSSAWAAGQTCTYALLRCRVPKYLGLPLYQDSWIPGSPNVSLWSTFILSVATSQVHQPSSRTLISMASEPRETIYPSSAASRASLACVPCRQKHVKCDAKRPVCDRRAAEHKTCHFLNSG
jgi:hypothetical protein